MNNMRNITGKTEEQILKNLNLKSQSYSTFGVLLLLFNLLLSSKVQHDLDQYPLNKSQ